MSFQKEYEDFLIHYGVPGMKWGHRKSQHANYTTSMVERDRALYGDKNVRRINDAMHKGQSYMEARHRVGNKNYKQGKRRMRAAKALGILGTAAGLGVAAVGDAKARYFNKNYANRPLFGAGEYGDAKSLKKSAQALQIAGLVTGGGSALGAALLSKNARKKLKKYSAYK